jgi:5-methylcytosine-specific restriction endonuclease McrA
VLKTRPRVRERLWLAQGGICPLCARPLHLLGAHVDHKIAISRGGQHEESNLQLTHAKCNLRKSTK